MSTKPDPALAPHSSFLVPLPLEWVDAPPAMTPAEAERYTRALARSHYENFHVATFFLPKRLHQDFHNVYAYCRWSDDLADEAGDRERALRLLAAWEQQLEECYQGRARHPVFLALAETARRREVPMEPFRNLRPTMTCSTIAVTPPIRSDRLSCNCADTTMPSVAASPISLAPRFSWRTSGRT